MVMTHLQQAKAEKELDDTLPESVPDFYRGRCVLVTGGSGFVGRVLVEKLLRSCPDIHTIYLLLRTRKGVPPNERLKKLTEVPLFDRLRTEQPDALAKLQVVAGDITQPGLKLSAQDAQLLCERVSVVFHSAASVRFDHPLEIAVRTNVRSTFELLELATQMSQLRAFVHVSTSYCNIDQEMYEEKLYPAPADWRVILKAADSLESHHLRVFCVKILGQHRNTYTFTKFLAEHIVNEYRYRLPVGIVRPSVVLPTTEDPIPGWIDNFNGPVGLMYAAGKGVVHTVYLDSDVSLDYIPCDIVTKGLIISSCDIARKGVGDLNVYQAVQSEKGRFTQRDFTEFAKDLGRDFPFKEMLYHPCAIMASNRLFFDLLFFFFHLLPAVLVDAVLFAIGKKPMLVHLQRRIYMANLNLAYFNMHNWPFMNQRFLSLERMLEEGDKDNFTFNMDLIDMRDLMTKGLFGVRKYMVHESDDALPRARRNYERFRIVHLILKTFFYTAVMWIVLKTLLGILMLPM